ncbi:MAG: hypothetical protein JRL30_16015 [Deltaproteobacteria bacterium]|nr:hypothetical protein [Deltaproteobacteria bacterium]
MKELEILLKTVGDGLKILAQGVNVIADKLENYVESNKEETVPPQARSVPVRETPRGVPGKETSRRTGERSGPQEKKGASASDMVYATICRAKGPVEIDRLAKRTGFEKKKLYNVLYRLKKQGRIETVGKGVYRKAG